jgi:hypothetical protein
MKCFPFALPQLCWGRCPKGGGGLFYPTSCFTSACVILGRS